MSVKVDDYKKLVKTVEGFRQIVQGCYGSLKKFENKVSDFEEKVTSVEGNLCRVEEEQKTVNENFTKSHQTYNRYVAKLDNLVETIANQDIRISNLENREDEREESLTESMKKNYDDARERKLLKEKKLQEIEQ